jgi:hypothetical protein
MKKMIEEESPLTQYQKEDEAIQDALKELILNDGELNEDERAIFIKKYCTEVNIRDIQFIMTMSKDDLVFSFAEKTYFLAYEKEKPYPLMSGWSKRLKWSILHRANWRLVRNAYVRKIEKSMSIELKRQRLKAYV